MNLLAGFESPDDGHLDGKAITGPAKDRMVVFQETVYPPNNIKNVIFGQNAWRKE